MAGIPLGAVAGLFILPSRKAILALMDAVLRPSSASGVSSSTLVSGVAQLSMELLLSEWSSAILRGGRPRPLLSTPGFAAFGRAGLGGGVFVGVGASEEAAFWGLGATGGVGFWTALRSLVLVGGEPAGGAGLATGGGGAGRAITVGDTGASVSSGPPTATTAGDTVTAASLFGFLAGGGGGAILGGSIRAAFATGDCGVGCGVGCEGWWRFE